MDTKKDMESNEIKTGSKIENDIDNIGKYLSRNIKDIPASKDNLYYFFSNKDIYNEKGTKIKSQEDYLVLIYILREYIKERNEFIFLYFKKINIDLVKILFNGYILFDINDNEKKNFVFELIKDIIPLFFSKDIFYLIYNKLSKIFRRFKLIEDKEKLFIQFNKIFDIWKFIYNIDNREKINSNFFNLIGKSNIFLINLNKYNIKEFIIYIEFEENFFNINWNNNNELINIRSFDFDPKVLKFKDIIKEKEDKIENIWIKINRVSINYLINKNLKENPNKDNIENFQTIQIDPPINISVIDILKDFKGAIKKIYIKIDFNEKQISKNEYEIVPSKNSSGYEINSYEELGEAINLIIHLSKAEKLTSSKTYNDILYEDIRYYGGMESFIPLIKIIKYFISEYKDKEDKIQKLIEILINIIKQMIKFIFYSKNNFENFKNVIVPLLSALGEINQDIPSNMKNILYSNNVFSLLYILIISSSFPFSIKKSYMKITELYNINKLNLNFDEMTIDAKQLRINSYEWYVTILIVIIEFILLSFNDIQKVPKSFINQISIIRKIIGEIKVKDLENYKIRIFNYVRNSILSLNYIFKSEKDDNILFENCETIDSISKYLEVNVIYNINNIKLPLSMIKVYLNLTNLDSFWYKLDEEKIYINDNNDKEEKNYKNIFLTFFKAFKKISDDTSKEIKNLIRTEFEDYRANQEYLIKIFPFLKNSDFKLKTELMLSELIDFHNDYHKLMKILFIFNKLWSDKKLFFNEEKKKKYLKYKSINYYTKNYLRPFLFPDLDYKYSYPKLTKFEIKEDFYMEKENTDEYNFNLDCQEFDNFNIDYEDKILTKINENHSIISFDVCLVKRTHHIKGKLFICNDNKSLIKKIIFYSYPKNISKNIIGCNTYNKKDKKVINESNNICFGAIFECPEKDMNSKIVINVKDIRMILRKIYFYRKSAVEIFTKNKSYFFNFSHKTSSENYCTEFTNLFAFFITEFFPIGIRTEKKVEMIGYSRQFESLLKSYNENEAEFDISKHGNQFISSLIEHWTWNENDIEFSTLDFLIYLNLLSNRSYNDIFQYPVFPVLFFYDKVKGGLFNFIERKLDKHIGFQDCTKDSKERKNLIKSVYLQSKKDYDEDEENEEIPAYFSTHFSNDFYVSNFLIRVFPFSFLAIEEQGDGFDIPNRLFFSIESSFYTMSNTKSDLRELIPELFYFPEIYWNINKIYFHELSNGDLVDDVLMPKNISNIDDDKKINEVINNSINLNDDYKNSNYYKTFIFLEKMRNLLESKNTDIISWINIIFGPKQKYDDNKKKDFYFRNESYIDYTDNRETELKFYRNNKIYMSGVEFGITPIQTVFEEDIHKRKNKNIIYNSNFKENKKLFEKTCKIIIKELKSKNNEGNDKNNDNIEYSKGIYKINDTKKKKKIPKNDFIENKNKNIFLFPHLYISYIYESKNIKIIGYKTGKIEVLKIKETKKYYLISELFDHKDEIIHINYNPRLNMICSSSKDGFLNAYILPNKLITTIKNPNKNYFDLIFLASNPFPSIIALECESCNIFSYTINGFKIKEENIFNLLKLDKNSKIDLYICSYFNENGGTFKDRLIAIEYDVTKKDNIYKCHLIKVPLFEEEEKTIDIKVK